MPKHGHEVTNSLRIALDHGYHLIDSAAIYRNENDDRSGIDESTVSREDIFVASKVRNHPG